MTRRTARDAVVGLGYLILVAALIALSVLVYNHEFTTYTTVSLHTDHVGSALQKGSDVKVRGIFVGQVAGVTTDGDGADVHLDLDPGQAAQLPPNMTAVLLPKTVFGERYVGLEFPAQPAAGHLRSGDTIEQDTSTQSVELEQLFSDLLPDLQAVQPEKLSATLGEVSAALRGRGDDLASTMQVIGTYLNKLSPEIPQITDDLDALVQTAQTYTQAAPELIDALNSFTSTAQTVLTQKTDYQNLLASVTSMAHTVGTFVNTNQQQLIGLAADSLPTLQLLARYSSEFPCISTALVNYIPTANQAFGAGTDRPGAHVILHVVPRELPYTAADLPQYTGDTGPRCPYSPSTALSDTALSNAPGIAGSSARTATGQVVPAAGMGTANSPQENQLIAELIVPTLPKATAFPDWSSLLLGPALRGAQVSLK